MKEITVDITHELKIHDTKFYKYSGKDEEKIKKYDKVYSVDIETWSNGYKMIKVEGERTLSGFYVEGKGFYDVLENQFYHQSYLNDNEHEIKSINEKFVKKKVKR